MKYFHVLLFLFNQGVLRIHVVEAKHLMKKDIGVLGKGKSDPYAVINIGAQEFRTKTIDNTVNPKWDFWCEVYIVFHIQLSTKYKILTIECMCFIAIIDIF